MMLFRLFLFKSISDVFLIIICKSIAIFYLTFFDIVFIKTFISIPRQIFRVYNRHTHTHTRTHTHTHTHTHTRTHAHTHAHTLMYLDMHSSDVSCY